MVCRPPCDLETFLREIVEDITSAPGRLDRRHLAGEPPVKSSVSEAAGAEGGHPQDSRLDASVTLRILDVGCGTGANLRRSRSSASGGR